MARVARIYITKIFLIKGIKQHNTATNSHEPAAASSGAAAVQRELAFLKDNLFHMT